MKVFIIKSWGWKTSTLMETGKPKLLGHMRLGESAAVYLVVGTCVIVVTKAFIEDLPVGYWRRNRSFQEKQWIPERRKEAQHEGIAWAFEEGKNEYESCVELGMGFFI